MVTWFAVKGGPTYNTPHRHYTRECIKEARYQRPRPDSLSLQRTSLVVVSLFSHSQLFPEKFFFFIFAPQEVKDETPAAFMCDIHRRKPFYYYYIIVSAWICVSLSPLSPFLPTFWSSSQLSIFSQNTKMFSIFFLLLVTGYGYVSAIPVSSDTQAMVRISSQVNI